MLDLTDFTETNIPGLMAFIDFREQIATVRE